MPIAWDRTSASGPTRPRVPRTCLTRTRRAWPRCTTYLNTQATNVASYASSPLWSVVDGPWKLQSFTTTGEVTFVPNPSYGGSPKPTLSKFVEVPFTSDQAALNEIKSGGPKALSMAELADEYLPQQAEVDRGGRLQRRQLHRLRDLRTSPLNLGNPTFGPVFSQLYFRQAFQHLVDGPGWLQKILGGYAVADLRTGADRAVQPLGGQLRAQQPVPVLRLRRRQDPEGARLVQRRVRPGSYLHQAGLRPGRMRGRRGQGPPAQVQPAGPERLRGDGRGDGRLEGAGCRSGSTSS